MYEIANMIYFTAAKSLDLASQLKLSGHFSGIASSREELFIAIQLTVIRYLGVQHSHLGVQIERDNEKKIIHGI